MCVVCPWAHKNFRGTEEKDEDGYDVDKWIRIKKNRRKCLDCQEELKPCSRCNEQKQRDNFEKGEWDKKADRRKCLECQKKPKKRRVQAGDANEDASQKKCRVHESKRGRSDSDDDGRRKRR